MEVAGARAAAGPAHLHAHCERGEEEESKPHRGSFFKYGYFPWHSRCWAALC